MTESGRHIVIIGNGIAGVTAARHIRKRSNHRITLVSEETKQPFARTALMYLYMGQLKPVDTELYEESFWAANRIERVLARVSQVDTGRSALRLANGDTLRYDDLVIATGSQTTRHGWPGQDLPGVGGLYHLQDLERMESWTRDIRRAVVVGGGLIGIEMAEMLHSRGITVTFLVREKSYSDLVLPVPESEMVNREIRRHGIDLRLGTELASIRDESTGKVRSVVTSSGQVIPCEFVGLATGVSPNIGFLRDTGLDLNQGILVNEFLQTNTAHIYAIGDCAELRRPRPGRQAIEPLWYTGRMMGQTVARTLCGTPALYDPGIWFNSAKFFSIEYQAYGHVPPQPSVDMASLHWEAPDGRRSIRISYETLTGAVKGCLLMGVRFRHETCARWIGQGMPIQEVLQRLEEAAFDPEFTANMIRPFRAAAMNQLQTKRVARS